MWHREPTCEVPCHFFFCSQDEAFVDSVRVVRPDRFLAATRALCSLLSSSCPGSHWRRRTTTGWHERVRPRHKRFVNAAKAIHPLQHRVEAFKAGHAAHDEGSPSMEVVRKPWRISRRRSSAARILDRRQEASVAAELASDDRCAVLGAELREGNLGGGPEGNLGSWAQVAAERRRRTQSSQEKKKNDMAPDLRRRKNKLFQEYMKSKVWMSGIIVQGVKVRHVIV